MGIVAAAETSPFLLTASSWKVNTSSFGAPSPVTTFFTGGSWRTSALVTVRPFWMTKYRADAAFSRAV